MQMTWVEKIKDNRQDILSKIEKPTMCKLKKTYRKEKCVFRVKKNLGSVMLTCKHFYFNYIKETLITYKLSMRLKSNVLIRQCRAEQ